MRARAFVAALFAALVLAVVAAGTAAAAGPYPPPTAAGGGVSASRIHVPGCTVFSGHGFASNTPITITDGTKVKARTRTDAHGSFRVKVCFDVNDKVGCHTLVATGLGADGRVARVTATVCITGRNQGNGSGDGNGNGIPFTGFDGSSLALGGITLVALGSGLLLLMEQRHRARRRTQRSTA